MKNRLLIFSLLVFVLGAAFAPPAQDSDYRINFNRNFGFSSGSKVRGTFTVSVVGPMENVTQVRYLIDGQEMAVVTEAPFRFKFQTDDYGFGWHELSAEVTLANGAVQTAPARRFQFVEQAEEFGEIGRIMIPLGGGILLITLLGIGGQFLFMRGRSQLAPGTERNYGLLGGTICKRCNRPFSISIFAINLGAARLARCPFCGYTGLVRRQPLEALRAAEAAEKESFRETGGSVAAGQPTLTPEEQLRRQLDNTKYTD